MQVLLGLQSNALKFTEKGKIEILVNIFQNDKLDKFLEISIIDTGIGIPYEDQDKLFKLFGFTQDTSQTNTKGIGIGLVISELIVHQFDGEITFKSEPGVGSKFTFTIKLNNDQYNYNNNIITNMVLKEYKVNSNQLVFNWKPDGPS